MFMLIYRQYLRDLVKFRLANTEFYGGETKEQIHVIGDSHILSFAHLTVDSKKFIPHLVMGCKIWHLADKNENSFKDAFKKVLLDLPKNSKVILNIGEIDCRDDEGFLPYFLANPEVDTAKLVAETVVNYVNLIKNITIEHPLDITFCGVPSPNGSSYAPDTKEVDLKLNIVKTINTDLAKLTESFITPYNPDENGWGKKDDFLDRFHLKPSVYVHLLKELY